MYVPPQFRQDDVTAMHATIAAARLATLVTVIDGSPLVSHVPMMLDPARGALGVLRCHLARANPQGRALAEGQEALAIILGPEAYVSPSWYASKREHGKVVPTWNYVAVHASGRLHVIDDGPGLHALVDDLTRLHEERRAEPWSVTDAPESYVAGQLRAIVGVELEIRALDGKWKLGQNRSEADVEGVACGLAASPDPRDREASEAIRRAAEI